MIGGVSGGVLAGADAGGPVLSHRRPHLDGLRAVAVYLVLFLHSGIEVLVGGGVGVDVFFVLSGYLVTQVLTRDLETSGSVRLAHFYARRVRRLLPAAVVMLLVTAVVYRQMYPLYHSAFVLPSFQAAFLYVANWYQINQSPADLAVMFFTNPTLHFWSLAVEEQFYIVWPVLLGALFAMRRRWSRSMMFIRAIVLAGAVASLAIALSIPTADAYRRTDARAYELLAGALLALTPSLVSRLARYAKIANVSAVALLGLLIVVASSVVELGPIHRGFVAAMISLALILSLEAAPTGLMARLLSLGPVVYLGLVSYGVYLWQWPVVIFIGRVADPNQWQLAGLTFLIATGIASLSFEMLERPIREWRILDRAPRAVVVAGLATSVICALVIVPAILRPDSRPTNQLPRALSEARP